MILGIPIDDQKSTAAVTPAHTTGTTELRSTQEIKKAKAMVSHRPGALTTGTMNTHELIALAQPTEPKTARST